MFVRLLGVAALFGACRTKHVFTPMYRAKPRTYDTYDQVVVVAPSNGGAASSAVRGSLHASEYCAGVFLFKCTVKNKNSSCTRPHAHCCFIQLLYTCVDRYFLEDFIVVGHSHRENNPGLSVSFSVFVLQRSRARDVRNDYSIGNDGKIGDTSAQQNDSTAETSTIAGTLTAKEKVTFAEHTAHLKKRP